MSTAIEERRVVVGDMPPTTNLEDPDPEYRLAHVPTGGMDATIDVAVTNSFGFGGFNTSLLLGRWSEA